MDEAERCHRLAILDRGRLVADGTPQALMDQLPGSTLRIACAEPRRMQKALAGDTHVLGAAQIGSDLRVLIDRRDDDADWLRDRVHAIDPAAEVELVAPNLEDVFVASTRKNAAAPEKVA
jgi:ABC-2 type transport system ATP-binding protein